MKPDSIVKNLFAPPKDETSFPSFFTLQLRQAWFQLQDILFLAQKREPDPNEDGQLRDAFLTQVILARTAATPTVPILWPKELMDHLNQKISFVQGRPLTKFLHALCMNEKWLDPFPPIMTHQIAMKIYRRATTEAVLRLNVPSELLPDWVYDALREPDPLIPQLVPGVPLTHGVSAALEAIRPHLPPPPPREDEERKFLRELSHLFSAIDRGYLDERLLTHELAVLKSHITRTPSENIRERPILLTPDQLRRDLAKLQKEPLADTPLVSLLGPAALRMGLGASMRYMVDALEAAGTPLEIVDASIFKTGSGSEVAKKNNRSVSRATAPIAILHFNSDVLCDNLLLSGKENWARQYRIGYFLWETSRLSEAHRISVPLVDEIWVPNDFLAKQYAAFGLPVTNVGHAMGEMPAADAGHRSQFNIPEDNFVVAFHYDTGSRLSRKNPMGLVKAFQKAFPKDKTVSLLLKTHNTDGVKGPAQPGSALAREIELLAELKAAVSKDRRILYFDESMDTEETMRLLGCADVYASLHRGEGVGMGMAEAMAMGLPVVATGWSGNTAFVNAKTACVVSAKQVTVPRYDFHYYGSGQTWAEPDIDEAAGYLKKLREDDEFRKSIAVAGKNFVSREMNLRRVGNRMRDRLETILTMVDMQKDACA